MNLPLSRLFCQLPLPPIFLAIFHCPYPSIIYFFITTDGKNCMDHLRWSFSCATDSAPDFFSKESSFVRAASCKVTCVLTIFPLHQISQRTINKTQDQSLEYSTATIPLIITLLILLTTSTSSFSTILLLISSQIIIFHIAPHQVFQLSPNK